MRTIAVSNQIQNNRQCKNPSFGKFSPEMEKTVKRLIDEIYLKAGKDKDFARSYEYVKKSPYELSFSKNESLDTYSIAILDKEHMSLGSYYAPDVYQNNTKKISVSINLFIDAVKQAATAIEKDIINEEGFAKMDSLQQKLVKKKEKFEKSLNNLYNSNPTRSKYKKYNESKKDYVSLQKEIEEIQEYHKQKQYYNRQNSPLSGKVYC